MLSNHAVTSAKVVLRRGCSRRGDAPPQFAFAAILSITGRHVACCSCTKASASAAVMARE